MESLLPPFHFWMSASLGVLLLKQLWLLAVLARSVFALGVSPPATPTRPSVAAQFPKHLWKLPCCWWNFSLHPTPSANSPGKKIVKRGSEGALTGNLISFQSTKPKKSRLIWKSTTTTDALLSVHCALVFTDNLRPSPSAPSPLAAAPQVTEQWPLTSPIQPANATNGFCDALETNPNFDFFTKTPTHHRASTSPLDASLALRAAFKSCSSLSKDSFVSCGKRKRSNLRRIDKISAAAGDGPYLKLCLQRDLGRFQVQRLSLSISKQNKLFTVF